jgi:hypothetical protein
MVLFHDLGSHVGHVGDGELEDGLSFLVYKVFASSHGIM